MKRTLKYFTLLFLCSSPIFDTTPFYSRMTSLIRVIIIMMLLLLTLIFYKESRKNLQYLIPYYLLCIIFLLINYIHSKSFISLFPGDFDYSFFSEILTVLKLMMPVTLIYSLYYQKFNKQDYLLIFTSWTILICISIILTNVLKISLSSYNQDLFIEYNIFEWSIKKYYIQTASKGFFNYANQEALILILLLTLNFYYFIKESKYYLFSIILCSITMLVLGTRVSSLGGLLVLIFLFFSYLFFIFIKKERYAKEKLLLLIPIIIWILILPTSPYSNRQKELLYHHKVSKEKKISIDTEEKLINKKPAKLKVSDEIKIKQLYIEENANPNLLPNHFYKTIYSYDYDVNFWYKFVNKYRNKNINYRLIEISIIKRVRSINNNFLDYLFGISNSRIQNIVNIERDFLLHYYAFGIIGSIILLAVYPFVLVVALIMLLKNINFNNYIKLVLVSLFIFCAYLTGNVLNSMTTIIVFSVVGGYVLLKEVK